ncbi:ABC transporter permease [Actinospica durhamensis]|uniref:ABC transporter permease n=1 Tax=Actinospica durhamensis TaxID=1508375 RepID=A0A941EKL0_9ACTN|nr:ABC transporter permease [Actinospica durhamensis]MBR7832598.1 ABC transporter permease [Actinospica durhamensis]
MTDTELVQEGIAPPAAARPGGVIGALAKQIGSRYAVVAVWIAMIAAYSAAEPGTFFTTGTFQAIFDSQQTLVFLAMALLCTITVGEFVDLSVPSVYGFAATVLPVLAVEHGWPVWAASVAAVLGATLVGAINGFLVVKVGVNTIVVTLGMSTFMLGISLWISNMNTISGLPAGFDKIAVTDVGGLQISFYYGLLLAAAFAYVLWCTPLGRHMRFVGANREVSRLSGVRVDRIRFGAFVAAGALAGLGAVVGDAYFGGFNASSTSSLLLPVFASVFLGTAVVEPGRFNPVGTFIGIYFLSTGILGLQLLGLQEWISNVFYGGVLVTAVTISTLLRKRVV